MTCRRLSGKLTTPFPCGPSASGRLVEPTLTEALFPVGQKATGTMEAKAERAAGVNRGLPGFQGRGQALSHRALSHRIRETAVGCARASGADL